MNPNSSMIIKRLKNGFVVEVGFGDEVYYPNLRTTLRHVAEELAEGEPASEAVAGEELEQMIHGAASVPAKANPKLERLMRQPRPKITASYIAGLKHIRWQNPAGRDLKKLVREAVIEVHGPGVSRARIADIFQRVQEKLAKKQARQAVSRKGA